MKKEIRVVAMAMGGGGIGFQSGISHYTACWGDGLCSTWAYCSVGCSSTDI